MPISLYIVYKKESLVDIAENKLIKGVLNMTLDERLNHIFETKKGSILIVDNTISEKQKLLIKACENFAKLYGISNPNVISFLKVSDINKNTEELKKYVKNNSGDGVILVRSIDKNIFSCDFNDYLYSFSAFSELKQIFPQKQVIYCFDSNDAVKSIEKVLSIIAQPGLSFDEKEYIDLKRYPTLVEFLCQKISQITDKNEDRNLSNSKHSYENSIWTQEVTPYIDNSLLAGNLQSKMDYHFLLLSDRKMLRLGDTKISQDRKLELRPSDYELQEQDFENCAAIFVDNSWSKWLHKGALGYGIQVLKQIRKQLDEKEINIPILYQSAHSIDDFTEEEKQEIEELGAVLATKDFFPKVCLGRKTADKEIEIRRLTKQFPNLDKYIPHLYEFSNKTQLRKDDLYIICSKIAKHGKSDEQKQELFSELDLTDNILNHKMYVLSMFHTYLKDQINNEKLQATSKDFYDLDEITKKLDDDYAESLEQLKPKYKNIVQKHRSLQPTVLTHIDAKWDNWFNNEMLGDYGSVQPGNEYKDIAKSLLDWDDGFTFVLDKDIVDKAIDNYIKLRKKFDQEFSVDENFKQNVYEMIVTESLRTIYYKADNSYLVNNLMKVVEKYIDEMSQININNMD